MRKMVIHLTPDEIRQIDSKDVQQKISTEILKNVKEIAASWADSIAIDICLEVNTINRQKGTPGKDLLQFGGRINAEDLALMSQAIETDCEKVDFNEW